MSRPQNPGGWGEERAPEPDRPPDPPNLKQTRLEARAIMKGWPVPEQVKVRVLNRLASIVDPDYVHDIGKPDHREAISAAKALISADLNTERLALDEERLRLERERFDWARVRAEKDQDTGEGDDYIIDLAPPDPPHDGDGPAA